MRPSRQAAGAIAVVAIIGVGWWLYKQAANDHEVERQIDPLREPPPAVAEPAVAPVAEPAVAPPAAPAPMAAAVPVPVPSPVGSGPRLCLEAGMPSPATLQLTRTQIAMCIDTGSDGVGDLCARWNRDTGALDAIVPIFDVEASDAPEPPPPPPRRRGVNSDEDDDRFVLHDERVDVCPADRACMTFLPDVGPDGDGAVQDAWLLDTGTVLLAIRLLEAPGAVLEAWDTRTARRLRRTPVAGVADDGDYTLSIELYGLTPVVRVVDAATHRARAAFFSATGEPRGTVARGSERLGDAIDLGDGRFAIVEVDDDDQPRALWVHAGTGAVIATVALPAEPGPYQLVRVDADTIAIVHPTAEAAVDLVDLRTRRVARTLAVPRC
jgi:hypothetical protein